MITKLEKNKIKNELSAKYKLNQDFDLEDILDHILALNKYLELAHYLQKNRGDWSEGCHYAKCGIKDFVVECEMDEQIVNDITRYFDDFEDGRVFRDCKWNYNVLFQIAKEQNEDLWSDYEKVSELVDGY